MQSTRGTNQNISLTTLAPRQIRVYWYEYHNDKFDNLLVFGPNYRAKDSLLWKGTKKDALEHVLEHSECSSSELMITIASIEEEARAAYANDVLNNMTRLEFQEMMAVDGCLFLLLAFSILGVGAQLKFSEHHLVFGTGYAAEETTRWLRSMFFVGNQVPFVVLEKLMALSFFQELKAIKQWKQPLELEKKTLYKFLMVGQEPKPNDLIHCLQLVILGTASASVEASSCSLGATTRMLDDADGIPSAWQLSEQGVRFEKLDGKLGSRRIHCGVFQRHQMTAQTNYTKINRMKTLKMAHASNGCT